MMLIFWRLLKGNAQSPNDKWTAPWELMFLNLFQIAQEIGSKTLKKQECDEMLFSISRGEQLIEQTMN